MVSDVDLFKQELDSKKHFYISFLEKICSIECGSEMIEGVKEVTDIIEHYLISLGFNVEKVSSPHFCHHILASNNMAGKQIILGGHLDTTYTDYSYLPSFHIKGDYAIGPGTADMKGGIVVFLAALDCLKKANLLKKIPITVIFNSDEERGAVTSRHIFQQLAKNAKCALFSECGGKNNDVVISRRAKISYEINVTGKGKHAGGKNITKISALEELAHKIIAMEKLNKTFAGDSFNVGKAWGGIASNTVPERATALLDIRYSNASSEKLIRNEIHSICSSSIIPDTSTELIETSYRPAWEKSDVNAALYSIIQKIGNDLGQYLPAESRGGTADSNWFGAVSVPCLDGLGPVGFDDHTEHEKIILSSLFERSLLVALLIKEIGTDELVF